ncbi:MAG: tetratricopeptide repeat protein [Pseudomonadota bacterium]
MTSVTIRWCLFIGLTLFTAIIAFSPAHVPSQNQFGSVTPLGTDRTASVAEGNRATTGDRTSTDRAREKDAGGNEAGNQTDASFADTSVLTDSDEFRITPPKSTNSVIADANALATGQSGAQLPGILGDSSRSPAAVIKQAYDALVAKEFDRAFRLAEPMAERGHADAQHLAGYLLEKGLGTSQSLGRAFRLYKAAAAQANTDAMLALGDMYLKGMAVEQDFGEAFKWFEKGADYQDPRAKSRLGALYADGLGTKQDLVKAMALFDAAASENETEAIFAIGFAYLNGTGKPQDDQLASIYFKRAANNGHAMSAYQLAKLHDAGVLGSRDPDKALKYLLMAADKDYAPAYTALGLLAHRGDGQGTAVEWFEKAAQEREPEGMFFFAVANNEGDGVEVDQAIARKYAVQVANHPGADEELKAKARHLIGEIDASQASMATLRD